MSVAVVVPFRGGCPHRERAWSHIRRLYAERHPEWQVIEAYQVSKSDTWCKAAAVNPAVAASDAEIIVQADADAWTDGLPEAVEAVRVGAPWAVPHLHVHRLDEGGTAAVLRSEDWRDQPLAQRPYQGLLGGGFVVAPRGVIHSIPLDPRFTGWG